MRAGDDALLQDLLDGRLAPEASTALRRRLETEPDLREAWDELRRVGDLVRGTPGERAPRDFLTRVRARIDAERTGAVDDAPPTEPAGKVLTFPGRFATVASGLAALLLVGVAMRWMAVDEEPVLGEPRFIESARAPTRDRGSAASGPEALDEPQTAQPMAAESVPPESVPPEAVPAEAVPAEERSAGDVDAESARARAAPPPPASPSGPVPTPGAFRPGDAVTPGLRTPSDPSEELERTPARVARASKARRGGARTKSVLLPLADHTWALEAEDLETGRARLALLVGGVLPGRSSGRVDDEDDEAASLRDERAGDDVLGSVLLTLDLGQVAALTPRGPAADRVTEKAADDDGSEVDKSELAEGAEEGKKAAARVRVRVLLVRRAP